MFSERLWNLIHHRDQSSLLNLFLSIHWWWFITPAPVYRTTKYYYWITPKKYPLVLWLFIKEQNTLGHKDNQTTKLFPFCPTFFIALLICYLHYISEDIIPKEKCHWMSYWSRKNLWISLNKRRAEITLERSRKIAQPILFDKPLEWNQITK